MLSPELMNRKWILVLIMIVVGWGPFIGEVWPAERVELVTEDEKKIAAAYFPASSPNSPAVILLPDTRCDWKKSFGRFPSKLNKAGFAVLATDLSAE